MIVRAACCVAHCRGRDARSLDGTCSFCQSPIYTELCFLWCYYSLLAFAWFFYNLEKQEEKTRKETILPGYTLLVYTVHSGLSFEKKTYSSTLAPIVTFALTLYASRVT
jgi:hypothetical protein